jgi:hypothetical protein
MSRGVSAHQVIIDEAQQLTSLRPRLSTPYSTCRTGGFSSGKGPMEPPLNPTVLAQQLGIREHKSGEGDGKLINWETFWELVEKAYWRNRTRRERDPLSQ